MREKLYLVLISLVVVSLIISYVKLRKNLFTLLIVFTIIIIISSVSKKVIDINTIPDKIYLVVERVVEEVGSSEYVRVNSDDEIEVFIDDKWVKTSEISVISYITGDITVEYQGKKIRIMDSGVASTIKVLKKLKVIKG